MKALLMQTPSLYGPLLRTEAFHMILGGFQFSLDSQDQFILARTLYISTVR